MSKAVWLGVLIMMVAANPITLAAEKEKAQVPAVRWITSLEEGIQKAKAEKKPILLDFVNPN